MLFDPRPSWLPRTRKSSVEGSGSDQLGGTLGHVPFEGVAVFPDALESKEMTKMTGGQEIYRSGQLSQATRTGVSSYAHWPLASVER
ncbi:hypothetical protein Poly21_42720 [Allorhodopirellula heiligendammensis]|uniref:Uncharacterized protein n=1 Tax=Allorhodopirellula heiligendammensis TaxID=2714739 RepID=A0A5C6BXN9_9BACT|nr:hypothetical protein Poly21_42720 [Allorhodopirellula heiligendammensis]